ncbi:MAG: hypothetical protein K6E11_04280 [Bacilli bacterium]|nr:hypothetical protein [Bacilli bacterium]
MKELDSAGVELVNFQAEVFEKSVKRFSCSSPIFIRRYMLSKHTMLLGRDISPFVPTLDSDEILDLIEEEYGESDYGATKYPKDVMSWIGYMYMYIVYTRQVSIRRVYSLFPPNFMYENYYIWHSQSEEVALDHFIEVNGYDKNVLDNEYLFKAYLKDKERVTKIIKGL